MDIKGGLCCATFLETVAMPDIGPKSEITDVGKHGTSLPRTGKYPKKYNIHARGAQIYIV